MQSAQISQNASQNAGPMSTTNSSDRNKHFSSILPYEDEVGLILHKRPPTPPEIFDGVQAVIDKFQATKEAVKGSVLSSLRSKIGTPFKRKTKSKLMQYEQDVMEGETRTENDWAMKAWRLAGRVTGAQDEIDYERWEAEQAIPYAVAAAAITSNMNTWHDGTKNQHGAMLQGSVGVSSLPGLDELGQRVS